MNYTHIHIVQAVHEDGRMTFTAFYSRAEAREYMRLIMAEFRRPSFIVDGLLGTELPKTELPK